ncbi:MAG: acyl-CoA synthetase [Rhodospirillaceae bacterium]|jgi:fatty-acyl-CoA synthase|nr:acyl-CoA synthetase [Rhodospirillaceae bacterium]
MTASGIYDTDLEKTPANHEPLSPISFLKRAAEVYPNRTAVIHGLMRLTYLEVFTRCRRLASALVSKGVTPGDTVAVLAPNIPAHFEAHYGVPMTGAVLNAINTRLDAATIAFILDHGEAKVLLVDPEFAAVAKAAIAESGRDLFIVDIDDPLAPEAEPLGEISYEAFLETGDPEFSGIPIDDEWRAIALSYTSGTTGNPKGVVTHHRGAYLNAIGNMMAWGMTPHPVYLWTLPMFHCNGWCFPWTITALNGTHVCLRKVDPAAIYALMKSEGVTHFCGAPTVLNMLVNAPEELRDGLPSGIKAMTAGAAPPAAVIATMEGMGIAITHTYGLTEVYGPCVVCSWHGEWDDLPMDERAALKARQGVRYHVVEGLEVMDPDTMTPVATDGETIGEIMFRGNVVMKGYLKNPTATKDSLSGGWFHSGDLAVKHPDGYVEIRDRSKDIIISGGENISTIEVESVLYKHPAVLEAAVVAKPDDYWGETPCAFLTLKDGQSATENDIIAFCRDNMAKFKVPKTVVFDDLPKTSTGKIQKFILRERARNP